jgi:putative hemolysin
MEIIIIIGLVLLNGIFAMSELALVSSRKFKLENARKKGSNGARVALSLSEHPTRFLSTVQIGITLIGILLGVYSGEKLTDDLTALLQSVPVLAPYSESLSVAIIVILITYLSIVLGELFPKRLGMTFPEPIAILVARPMQILSRITAPFVWLLTASNDLLLRMLGISRSSDSRVSEEEIKSIVRESAEGGEILDIEQNIVERVFELGDRKVNTLLTHRKDIVYFDITDSFQTIREKITSEKHSAYPVCEEDDIDRVIGLVLLKDLFSPESTDAFDLRRYMREPLFINENTLAYKVLEIFREKKMHYAIILDEYGTTQGIVTMDDVMDALLGDASESDQDEYRLTARDEHSWLVDGQYSVIEFSRDLDITLEEEAGSRFTTVAGLMIHRMNTLPVVGDKIEIDGYTLEVIDKDGQRIDKILVTRLPGAPA